jgi:hypothetical protein
MEVDSLPKVFKIAQILDKTTVVVSGDGIGTLHEAEMLSVLAFGAEVVPNVPVVVVKATLETTSVTSAYAIARTPVESREEKIPPANPFGALGAFGNNLKLEWETRIVRIRPALKIQEAEERGNPATQAIATGDTVIRQRDYRAYVDSLGKKGIA